MRMTDQVTFIKHAFYQERSMKLHDKNCILTNTSMFNISYIYVAEYSEGRSENNVIFANNYIKIIITLRFNIKFIFRYILKNKETRCNFDTDIDIDAPIV
jgi:hypothetical protein